MAGDLLQVFNAATQLGNAYINQQRYLNTQIANEEVKNLQLDFNDKLNATMSELSRSGDWNNFDETIEDFYSEYRDTAEGMVSSPYASRIVNDMLNQSYQDTKWKVKSMQLQAQKNAIVQNANKTLENLATSSVDMQYAATMGVDSLNGCLANGALDPQTYTQNAVTFIASALQTKAQTAGTSLINSGASWEQVEAKAKEVLDGQYDLRIVDTNSFSTYEDTDQYGNKINRVDPNSATVDASQYLNREKITNDTLKNLKAQWETKRKEVQEYNDNRMEELYVAIAMGSDGEYDKNYANAKNFFSGMNADTLPDKRLKYWADALAGMEKKVADNPTTSKGNSTAKVEAFKGLTNTMDAYITAAFNGDFDNLNCAKEAWVTDNYETIVNERYGGDKSAYPIEKFGYDYVKEINAFNEAVAKNGMAPGKVKDLLNNSANIALDFVRIEGKYKTEKDAKDAMLFNEQRETLKELMFDLVAECNFSKPEEVEGIAERYKKQLSALYLETFDYGVQKGFLKPSEDSQIANVVYNLQKDTSAYTTGDGIMENRTMHFAPGAEEGAKKNASRFANKIAEATGVDASKLTWNYEQSLYDANAIPVYMDTAGNQYKLYSEDGKSYEVQMKSNGTDSWQKVKKKKEDGTAFGDYREQEKYYNELAWDFYETEIVPPGVSEKDYKRMNAKQKKEQWKKWVTANPEAAEDLKAKYLNK